MVTYQYLYAFIVINFVIQGIVLLLGSMSKKISRFEDILISLCWFVFSLFYVLRISRNLPADLHYNHIFLELFLTIVYGFGFYISVNRTSIHDIKQTNKQVLKIDQTILEGDQEDMQRK